MKGIKKTIYLAALALSMGVTIYLTFDKFFTGAVPEFAKNIAAGFFGAVITMVITAVLLNSQSLSELGKEKSVGIFNAKLKMFTEFLDFINLIIADDVITEKEIKRLKQWALKLSLITGSNTTSTVTVFIQQTLELGNFRWDLMDSKERKQWKEWYDNQGFVAGQWDGDLDDEENEAFVSIGALVHGLKIDLGEEDVSDIEKASDNWYLIDELLSS